MNKKDFQHISGIMHFDPTQVHLEGNVIVVNGAYAQVSGYRIAA